jgi:hypothetical protein
MGWAMREELAGRGVGATPAMQRILDLLRTRSPLSPREIAKYAFIAITTLEGGGYLKKMKSLGLIHIDGWLKSHNGFTTPLYAIGPKDDCPRPKFRSVDRDSQGMAKIVSVLRKHDKLDYRELARLAEVSVNTIKNSGYMTALLEQKRIHISGWKRSSRGHLNPIYSVGGDKNVPKPALLTRQEVMQRHRMRQKVLSSRDGSLCAQLRSLLNSTSLDSTSI